MTRRTHVGWWIGLAAIAAAFAAPFASLVVNGVGEASESGRPSPTNVCSARSSRTVILAAIVTVLATVLGVGMAWCAPARRLRSKGAACGRRAAARHPVVRRRQRLRQRFGGRLLEQALGWSGLPEVRGLRGAVIVLDVAELPVRLSPGARPAVGAAPIPGGGRPAARRQGEPAPFRRIVLPRLGPAITSGAVLVALYVISDFGAVQFVGYDTLTRTIFAAGARPGPISGHVTRARRVGLRRDRGGVDGSRHVPAGRRPTAARRPVHVPLRRWRWPASVGSGPSLRSPLSPPSACSAGGSCGDGPAGPGAAASTCPRRRGAQRGSAWWPPW